VLNLSPFGVRQRPVPGQVKVAGAGNEIVAIPKLVDRRDIEGALAPDGGSRAGEPDHLALRDLVEYTLK